MKDKLIESQLENVIHNLAIVLDDPTRANYKNHINEGDPYLALCFVVSDIVEHDLKLKESDFTTLSDMIHFFKSIGESSYFDQFLQGFTEDIVDVNSTINLFR